MERFEFVNIKNPRNALAAIVKGIQLVSVMQQLILKAMRKRRRRTRRFGYVVIAIDHLLQKKVLNITNDFIVEKKIKNLQNAKDVGEIVIILAIVMPKPTPMVII